MNLDFFLGANSCTGFYSLYDGFCAEPCDYLRLIKAGPGGGKSGFMRKIAQAAQLRGLDTECILCSGDPSSLDGVYIPELHIGYMDATSPHASEPEYFAACSDYVNLGAFCSRTRDPRIIEYTQKYKQMYKTAYAYLAAAGSIEKAEIDGLLSAETLEKIKKRARSRVLRLAGGEKDCNTVTQKRFIRALTCDGEVVLTESINKLCKLTVAADDRFGAQEWYLREVYHSAVGRERNIILCPSPLCPDRLDAVILPDSAVGFFRTGVLCGREDFRRIRLDDAVAKSSDRQSRSLCREKNRQCAALTQAACFWLSEAKKWHDMLEQCYRPYVDFAEIDSLCEREIEKIFG